MSLFADWRRGQLARQQEEEENAQYLARQVITYLDKQLNGGTSKYIDANKFHREFPDFRYNTNAHAHVRRAGYFMCRTVTGGEIDVSRRTKPAPHEKVGCFVL